LAETRDKVVVGASMKGPRALAFVGSRNTQLRMHGEMINSMRSVLNSMPLRLVLKVRRSPALLTRSVPDAAFLCFNTQASTDLEISFREAQPQKDGDQRST
jgi:hypothetical protein